MASEQLTSGITFGDKRDQLPFEALAASDKKALIVAGGCPDFDRIPVSYPNSRVKVNLKLIPFEPGDEKTGPYSRKLKRLIKKLEAVGVRSTVEMFVCDWAAAVTLAVLQQPATYAEWLEACCQVRQRQAARFIEYVLSEPIFQDLDEVNEINNRSVNAVRDALKGKVEVHSLVHTEELVRATAEHTRDISEFTLEERIKQLLSTFIALTPEWKLSGQPFTTMFTPMYLVDFGLIPLSRMKNHPGTNALFLSLPTLKSETHRKLFLRAAARRATVHTSTLLDIEAV